jgi:glycosyltransferase involved in cell wall biosynthesis
MNVVIIGHTYIAPINRKKWVVLAQLYPDVNLTIIIPKTWKTELFEHVADISDEYYLPNCRFVALDAQRTGNELLYAYRSHQLYRILKQAKPNILQVEQGYSSAVYAQANIVARMVDSRIISTFFTWVNWEQHETLKHKIFFRPLEKINLAYAQAAIVGNRDAATLLIKRKFTKPIYVIPQLGVDTELFKPQEQVNNGRKRIGFLGRFVEEKGIFTLLEAFADLAHFFPEWDLIFVGKGPETQKLEAAILHHNIHERTHIIAPVTHEQIPSILNSLSILVLPSHDTPTWREQFGHVLIEAMSCGVPIIGSDAGEIPNVIGTAGLVFEQKNPQALLAQLKTLMQDETLRHALIKEGLQLANTTYSHQAIAQQTHESWLKMIQKQGSS